MSLAVFRGRLCDLAIALGGMSVVARVMARQAWKRFEASLRADVTHDTDDIPDLHDLDFRYWHSIRLRSAQFSIYAPACGSCPG
jgi:hypothetical protein